MSKTIIAAIAALSAAPSILSTSAFPSGSNPLRSELNNTSLVIPDTSSKNTIPVRDEQRTETIRVDRMPPEVRQALSRITTKQQEPGALYTAISEARAKETARFSALLIDLEVLDRCIMNGIRSPEDTTALAHFQQTLQSIKGSIETLSVAEENRLAELATHSEALRNKNLTHVERIAMLRDFQRSVHQLVGNTNVPPAQVDAAEVTKLLPLIEQSTTQMLTILDQYRAELSRPGSNTPEGQKRLKGYESAVEGLSLTLFRSLAPVFPAVLHGERRAEFLSQPTSQVSMAVIKIRDDARTLSELLKAPAAAKP